MNYSKLLSRLALPVVGLSLATQSFALGTTADVTVTNNVTMTYQVNSVDQNAATTVDFEVDRKYIVNVTTTDTNWVTAVPGQTFASGNYSSILFSVTNNTNDSTVIRLALVDQGQTAITAFDAPTAELSADAITVWEDTNDDGDYDLGTDVLLGNTLGILPNTIAPYAEDETRDYYVSVGVDAGDGASLFEAYTLVAAVADGGGAVIQTDDSGNSTVGVGDPTVNPNDMLTVQEVFAEFASGLAEDLGYDFVNDLIVATIDDDSDGQASNTSGFRTRVALGIAKHVETLWDPISGNQWVLDSGGPATIATGNNPKAIPGAVLLYVIGVSADSGVDATTVLLDDDIPETLVRLGNANSIGGIVLPDTVSMDINGTTVIFDLDGTVAADLNYYVETCAGGVSSALQSGSPEIDDANLGDCDALETGYVAYTVTVGDL